jgi:competence protein ComEA
VEKPGVYKLPGGSRIGDALVVAGGLAGDADRNWVGQTLNLAELVKDGQKIYIPRQSENSEGQKIGGSDSQNSGKVNINKASVSELDGLSGIGETRAQAIVEGRPYTATEEIVEKAKVPKSVYENIKDQLSVY